MLRKVKPWEWLVCIGIVVLTAGILFPLTACACKQASPATHCMSNVKQQALAMIIYAGDWDDRFPLRDSWMDSITPALKRTEVLRDPEVEIAGGYGYAFDSRLSGALMGKIPNPDKAPLIYDSLNLGRNASDPFTSFPAKGRHKGKNVITYADGYAKSIRKQ